MLAAVELVLTPYLSQVLQDVACSFVQLHPALLVSAALGRGMGGWRLSHDGTGFIELAESALEAVEEGEASGGSEIGTACHGRK